ncbi:MAG: ParB/RepB/Spo0J family partition protein [Clostridia bacterium]|nr:ParB/RepB/Spo0J family partition protein [Clostridia bacterium]
MLLFERKKQDARAGNDRRSESRSYGGFAVAAPAGAAVYGIPLERIQPNPSQPRRIFSEATIASLADSIRQYGLIQPVTVRPSGLVGGEPLYEIVEGERRFRAAKLLGLREIPCVIVNTDSRRSAEIALTENVVREDLNMFEEANAIASLIEIYSLSRAEVAKKLSCSEEEVGRKLSVLRLSQEERAAVISNSLSRRHVAAILRLKSDEQRRMALKRICSEGMGGEATEQFVTRILEGEPSDAGRAGEAREGKQILVLHDVRLFFNTLDRAIEVMRGAGVNVQTERTDRKEETEILIRIPTVPPKPKAS